MSLYTNTICDKCQFVLMHCRCSKIHNAISDAGFKNDKIYHRLPDGPGDFKSYFDYLIERKLSGHDNLEPNPEELWILMKMQLNFYQGELAKASEDYLILSNRLSAKEEYIKDLQLSLTTKEELKDLPED